MFLVAVDDAVLRRNTIVVFGCAEILRNKYTLGAERHVLKLNEQLLTFRGEKREVLADRTEIIIVFLRLELAPGVFQLRAFEGLSREKRFFRDALTLAIEEDIMMN